MMQTPLRALTVPTRNWIVKEVYSPILQHCLNPCICRRCKSWKNGHSQFTAGVLSTENSASCMRGDWESDSFKRYPASAFRAGRYWHVLGNILYCDYEVPRLNTPVISGLRIESLPYEAIYRKVFTLSIYICLFKGAGYLLTLPFLIRFLFV